MLVSFLKTFGVALLGILKLVGFKMLSFFSAKNAIRYGYERHLRGVLIDLSNKIDPEDKTQVDDEFIKKLDSVIKDL